MCSVITLLCGNTGNSKAVVEPLSCRESSRIFDAFVENESQSYIRQSSSIALNSTQNRSNTTEQNQTSN